LEIPCAINRIPNKTLMIVTITFVLIDIMLLFV
jgi:hypothetical protein